ncbi:oligopeptide/dipeptide ABC transporter ATP-binding protein [Roseateles oligotrophus]|uniref:ABC transporter ATP-binding protein n=1 Tax=Roseateles oligotrophus TaxID=1769250 RepID=A0ABT2YK07_9BURK|nr:ABC transporter ATP-binding protein [Roseateles oligotrophus]MCV2370400.1 ABC transporter ATP-binding protein [Roseateles oligotrophus]
MSSSNNSPDAVLSFEQAGIQFDTRLGLFGKSLPLHALQDVSFDLRRGEILGIVGESGSGKSTLGKLAMRLLEPSSGAIRYEGKLLQDYRGSALKQLRCDLQMVFQDPNASLNPRFTIAQCLREPFVLHKRGKAAEQQQEIAQLLQIVGLPATVLQRYPHELSGGQKQRVVIARALALKPKVLIADEAVAALDASVKAQIINLLLDLQKQLQLSIIFISHDLPMVEAMCDRVLVLYLGRLMEDAPRELINRGGLHPYTQALWKSSPTVDTEAGFSDEEPLSGEIPSPLKPPAGCVFHTRCPKTLPECKTRVPELQTQAPGHGVACLLYPRKQ